MKQLKAACLVVMTAAFMPDVALAESVPQVRSQPGYYRVILGQYEVTALSDGTMSMPLDKLLMRIGPDTLRQLLAEKSIPSPVETSINAFLVNTGTHLVLIDTGSSPQSSPTVGRVEQNLIAAGYHPEQVDTVLMTHLNGDHFGGLVHDGKPTYPNATVYVAQQESDFWLSPQSLAQAAPERKAAFQRVQDAFTILAAEKKVKTFSGNAPLLPGITHVFAPGHTPGHTAYLIESDGKKLLAWGDIVHVKPCKCRIRKPPSALISIWIRLRAREKRCLHKPPAKAFWLPERICPSLALAT